MTRKFTPEWKASRTPRPAIWADVPDEQWNDWRWQLSHRLNTLEELGKIVNLASEETFPNTSKTLGRITHQKGDSTIPKNLCSLFIGSRRFHPGKRLSHNY